MDRVTLITPVKVMEFSPSLPYFYKEGICGMPYWGRGVICAIQWKGKVVPMGDQILDLGMSSTLTNGLTQ